MWPPGSMFEVYCTHYVLWHMFVHVNNVIGKGKGTLEDVCILMCTFTMYVQHSKVCLYACLHDHDICLCAAEHGCVF